MIAQLTKSDQPREYLMEGDGEEGDGEEGDGEEGDGEEGDEEVHLLACLQPTWLTPEDY